MRKKGTKAMGNNGIELERDGFKSRTGFILACIGSAVGMGNIWRFPYMVSAWGGMTFYTLCNICNIDRFNRCYRGDGTWSCD